MSVWYDGFECGDVEMNSCWEIQAGTFGIYRAASARAGGRYINWLRGKNVASTLGAKRISHLLPPAADVSKSVLWAFMFAKGDNGASDVTRFWLFANEPGLQYNSVTVLGYYVNISNTNINLIEDNLGALTIVLNNAWASDTEEHLMVVTREVSGANRFWRTYLDPPWDNLTDPGALLGGPTNDATHGPAQALYYGVNQDDGDRVGEILIQS